MSDLFPWLKEDFDERLSNIKRSMKERQLNAIVIYSNPSSFGPETSTHGYIRYLSNWSSGLSPSLLVFPREGELTLFVALGPDLDYAREITWIPNIKLVPSINYGRGAVSILKDLNICRGRIGIIGMEEMPVPIYRDIIEGVSRGNIVNARDILDEMKMVKSDKEIVLMREAAGISDMMFETLIEASKEGDFAYKAQAKMEYVAKLQGVEYAKTWIYVGPKADGRTWEMPEEAYKKIERGDQILAGTYIIYKGYYSHQLRTGVKGKPTEEYREMYNICLEAQKAGINSMKQGLYISDINKAIENVIQRKYSTKGAYRFRNGHAIGMDYAEEPATSCFPQLWFSESEATVPKIRQKPGMTFEIHPNIFLPEKGGVAVGDICLVTEKGGERLHKFPQELFQV